MCIDPPFPLEMPVASVAERYHEIVSGSTGREIEDHYSSDKDGAESHREALKDLFRKDLKNLFIIPTKVSIPEIASYLQLVENHYQVKVGVVGIDYLGLLDGPGREEYEIVSKLARDIKGLSKMLNLPLVVIAQTSRKAGSGDTEISLDMGRGSGAIEEAADFCLGLFQAKQQQLSVEAHISDYDLILKILKNRKGPKGSMWKLDFDPTNFRLGRKATRWITPSRTGRKDSL